MIRIMNTYKCGLICDKLIPNIRETIFDGVTVSEIASIIERTTGKNALYRSYFSSNMKYSFAQKGFLEDLVTKIQYQSSLQGYVTNPDYN